MLAFLQGQQDGEYINALKQLNNFFIETEKNMQEMSISEIKKEFEMPKKIKLKYGQGSISYRPKEKRYSARYYIDGKIQKPIYAKTQTEIIKLLKNAINNKKQLKNKIEISLTLNKWLTEWLNTYKKNKVADSTYKGLETNINKYLIPLLGEYELNKLDSLTIQKALNTIKYPRQKEICYNTLNASLRKALQLKLTDNNYMIAVEKEKAKSKKSKAFTTTEQDNFIKALDKFKDYKTVFLAYLFTGARRNELLNIKYCDIDFNNDTITINGTKSKNSLRTIPLNKKLKELLINYKDGYLFDFTQFQINHTFTKICKSINLNGFTVHSLRHTFATRCLENNISIKLVQKWLGHSKINITLETYTHILTEFEKDQSKKINDIF